MKHAQTIILCLILRYNLVQRSAFLSFQFVNSFPFENSNKIECQKRIKIFGPFPNYTFCLTKNYFQIVIKKLNNYLMGFPFWLKSYKNTPFTHSGERKKNRKKRERGWLWIIASRTTFPSILFSCGFLPQQMMLRSTDLVPTCSLKW